MAIAAVLAAMHPIFAFALGSLATYRLALMFAKESGPARVFRKLRHEAPPQSALREGLECVFCESVWWSALITGLAVWDGACQKAWCVVWWLAQSAVAVAINQAFTKGKL